MYGMEYEFVRERQRDLLKMAADHRLAKHASKQTRRVTDVVPRGRPALWQRLLYRLPNSFRRGEGARPTKS